MPTKQPMEPMENAAPMAAPEPAAPAMAAAAPVAKKGKLVPVLVILILLALAALGYFGWQYMQATKDPNVANQKKIEEVVMKVNKIIDLPSGEIPTLATVSDLKNLQNQPFFANAEVGDQVLLYTNARKAYLYNPTKNLIIEVASLNIGQQ